MANANKINISGIGQLLFEHSKRAKRLTISIRPEGVRVAVPKGMSFERALDFVYTKKQWVQKHLAKIKQNEKQLEAQANSFRTIDKAKSRKKLLEMLQNLAGKYGFTYNKVYIRNQKTRWGSCSQKNNISLNMKLILLPEELTDYVILHELVHTRIHNHSKKFWAELDRYLGNSKVMAKRLRINDLRLM
jgi:predicted metal-dependent hydrolase